MIAVRIIHVDDDNPVLETQLGEAQVPDADFLVVGKINGHVADGALDYDATASVFLVPVEAEVRRCKAAAFQNRVNLALANFKAMSPQQQAAALDALGVPLDY